MPEILKDFSLHQRVNVLRDNKLIGEAIVAEVKRNHQALKTLVIKDLELFPAQQMLFGYVHKAGGWKLLFKNPTTNELAPSEVGPIYQFESLD